MEYLQDLVKELRALLRKASQSDPSIPGSVKIQSQVRGKIKSQLGRKDLRIPVELALLELLAEFEGFDSSPPPVQSLVRDQAGEILKKIESLLETEAALNADRIVLPPPPPLVADVMEPEETPDAEIEVDQRMREHSSKGLRSDAARRPGSSPRSRGRRRGRPRGGPRPGGEQKAGGERPDGPQGKGPEGQPKREDLKFHDQKAADSSPAGKEGKSKRRRHPRRDR